MRLIRNIIAVPNVQDHVIHFYHLHALDWVDITSGLKADPAMTSALAASLSDWPLNSPSYFKGVQEKLQAFVSKGRLGPFANAYWGHPAYKLPPEANLITATIWKRWVAKGHYPDPCNPGQDTSPDFLVGGMAIDRSDSERPQCDKLMKSAACWQSEGIC
jgi:[NiFe] hydrogenase large subunit/hydrogenase large subunit